MAKKTVTYSKHYQKVKDYYDQGLWNLYRVGRAVVNGWITAEEYKEITGKDYEG